MNETEIIEAKEPENATESGRSPSAACYLSALEAEFEQKYWKAMAGMCDASWWNIKAQGRQHGLAYAYGDVLDFIGRLKKDNSYSTTKH